MGNKYEGIEGILIKKEEMHAALVNKCPSPKRQRDTSMEVIILDNDSESKTSNKHETGLSDKVFPLSHQKKTTF